MKDLYRKIKLPLHRVVVMILVSGVGACATGHGLKHENKAQTFATETGVEIGALGPQTLEHGACGLFLWQKRHDPTLVFFSRLDQSAAFMVINGDRIRLDIRAAPKIQEQGQTHQLHLSNDDLDLTATVTVHTGRKSGSGVLVPEAQLKLRAGQGPRITMPLAGLVGCQP